VKKGTGEAVVVGDEKIHVKRACERGKNARNRKVEVVVTRGVFPGP
jgi:hypothetical protein